MKIIVIEIALALVLATSGFLGAALVAHYSTPAQASVVCR